MYMLSMLQVYFNCISEANFKYSLQKNHMAIIWWKNDNLMKIVDTSFKYTYV